MLLSAIDPALLMYQQEHWQTRQPHFYSRIKALALHRDIVRKYNQQFAISYDIAALLQQYFPWNDKTIGELRDLRQFMLEEIGKARFITKTRGADEIALQPSNLTCEHIDVVTVIDAWKELLCACVEGETNSEFDVQVATWETPVLLTNSQSMIRPPAHPYATPARLPPSAIPSGAGNSARTAPSGLEARYRRPRIGHP